MSNGSWTAAVIRSLFCVVIAGAACATSAPVVKPTCANSWDRNAD